MIEPFQRTRSRQTSSAQPIVIHSFSSWNGIATLTKPSAIAENHTTRSDAAVPRGEKRCRATATPPHDPRRDGRGR